MSTIGYGDITPLLGSERAFAILVTLMGVSSFAIFVTIVQRYYDEVLKSKIDVQ